MISTKDNAMKRPDVTDEMIRHAAEVVAQKVKGDVGSIVEAYCHPMDGYELAKRLERECFWDVSRDDMELLDEMEGIIDDQHQAAEKEWFESNDIQPPFPIGTKIKEGIIKGIYEYRPAYYQVKEYGCTDPNRHRLIKFERAVSVE
ncbi:hypothetical protein SAMN02745127_02088 [Oceanospirillum multiglobuliferum]|uniref:Uncharacterized protein n=1 Tax=Oceanospirillum multiglobuliferum TaxID=64969 RepID=A0A1T4QZL0_9GAMM|nr:hypothetical protein [Oceanospirillum multiglobuliferum]OPX57052.1 hypothetical protein BTE48_01075 [Oceanospirillum multiglobuliferum]SKA08891.1 hypothetical protein SAMN02745127_02088 [Oceanospirillum multiglobuliferum]